MLKRLQKSGIKPTVKYQWLNKQTYGSCDLNTGEIYINLDLFIADTFIHEWLHIQYPRASERWVEKKTKQVVESMIVADIKTLVRKVNWMAQTGLTNGVEVD